DRRHRVREVRRPRGGAVQRDLQRDRAGHHRAQREVVPALRPDGEARRDAAGRRARGRRQRRPVPLLGARAVHHRRRARRDGGNGPLHLLTPLDGATEEATMPTVKETFDAMSGRFRADKAAGTSAVIQYDVGGDGGGTWHAVIKDGTCTVKTGPAPTPNLTLQIAAPDWLDMLSGKQSGQMLFMS